VICPSCKQNYGPATKICVTCGIDIRTGKPLVTSRALDENDLAIRTDTWVRVLSWVLWFGLFPIASEAFGTKKAITIWWITGITVFTSLLFFIPYYTQGIESPGARPWVMWAGTTDNQADRMLHRFRSLTHGRIDDDSLKVVVANRIANQGEFHAYQLLTQAFLHAGIMHLAGNLVFMLVFGIRVNELIGNLKTAVVYPILAVLSALIFLFAARNDPLIPSLGASGAIMGLAGMYFVFFPVQKVHMVFWMRLGFIFRWRLYYKMFRMSGFWLLVLWVGLNDLLPTLLHGSQTGDGVAHWAHLGGFISGFVIAIVLLVTRQVNANGSDILSMMLGPTAWKLLGRAGTQPA
jgi:membrane associated rhomboid family serine protease